MVSNISGMGAFQGIDRMRPPAQLTEEQQATIQDILSKYDPENITEEDAKEIFQAFSDAGIKPGPGIREAIAAAGFDPEDLRTKADPDWKPGPPPQGDIAPGRGSGINASSLQTLQSILSQFDLANLSEDDLQTLIAMMSQSGLLQQGSFINLSA